MFTGIIETSGRLEQRSEAQGGFRFTVAPAVSPADLVIGESIAVNGVCLTAEPGSTPARLVFFVSDETLSRTTHGELRPGARLNLERSLRPGDRMGGHLVSGHVDAAGTIRRWEASGEGRTLEVGFPPELAPFIASKGSIAVDGISLTVVDVLPESFTVAVIPHTVQATTLVGARPGMRVNLEVDMLARYVVRAVTAMQARSGTVTEELLRRAGF